MMSPPSRRLSVDNGVDVSEGACLFHLPPDHGQAGAGEPYAVDMYRSGPRSSTLQEGGRAEGSRTNTPSIEILPSREGNKEEESASNSLSPLRRRHKKRRRGRLQRGNSEDGEPGTRTRSSAARTSTPSEVPLASQSTTTSTSLTRRSRRTQAGVGGDAGLSEYQAAAREVLDLSAVSSSDVIRLDCDESPRPLPPPPRRTFGAFGVDDVDADHDGSFGAEPCDTTGPTVNSIDATTSPEDQQQARVQGADTLPTGRRGSQSARALVSGGPRAAVGVVASAEVPRSSLRDTLLPSHTLGLGLHRSARGTTSPFTPFRIRLHSRGENQIDEGESGTIGAERGARRGSSVRQAQGEPSGAAGPRRGRAGRNNNAQRTARSRSRGARNESGTSTTGRDRVRDSQELHDEELARQLQSEENSRSSWGAAILASEGMAGTSLVDVSSDLSNSSDDFGGSSGGNTPMGSISWHDMDVMAEINGTDDGDGDDVIEVDDTAGTSSRRREGSSASSRVRSRSRGGVDVRRGSSTCRENHSMSGGAEGSRRSNGGGIGGAAGSRGTGERDGRGGAASSRARGGRSSRLGSASSEAGGRRQRTSQRGARSSSRRSGGVRIGVADSFPMPGVLGLQLFLGDMVGEGDIDHLQLVGGWGALAREFGSAARGGSRSAGRGRLNASQMELMYRDLSPADYERLLALDGGNGGGGGSSANGASKGLSERELSLMPIEIGTGSGATEQCCICMEEMKPTDAVTRLPACIHVYHSECISKWLKEQATCPIDKTAVCFSRP